MLGRRISKNGEWGSSWIETGDREGRQGTGHGGTRFFCDRLTIQPDQTWVARKDAVRSDTGYGGHEEAVNRL